MKRCPQCNRTEAEETLRFCRADGTRLITGPSASDSTATAILPDTPRRAQSPTQQIQSTPSIAVLPFAHLSADADNEYFCDGLAEELLNSLANIEGLRVASRTSAFSFKGKEVDITEIGQKLKVRSVLEGSVRKAGNRLRITVQLINVADGYHLWSERYDRELQDIFDVQDEITCAVVRALRGKLLGEEKAAVPKRHTDDPAAYQLYLKGRYFWNKRPQAGFQQGIDYFRQAIETDPGYALAYSGLADAYSVLGSWESGLLRPIEAAVKAKAAAVKALEIDDGLAEAHTSLAYVLLHFDWDWAGAEKGFARALRLNPKYVHAHHWHSHLCMATGRVEESLTSSLRALELDPLDPIINIHLAWHYWLARQPGRVVEQCSKSREIEPNFFWSHFFTGLACGQRGTYGEAAGEFRKAVGFSDATTFALAGLGHVLGLGGERDAAQAVLAELRGGDTIKYVPPYDVAMIHLGMGEQDAALEWLERAYEERSSWMTYLNIEPRLDPLRSDPRFADLVRRVGLPQ